jgi:hypothetical protein
MGRCPTPWRDDDVATGSTLPLWQTGQVLASVSAAAQQPVFPVQNLIILAIVAAVVYPLQKKLRETVSRRRRERWAEEERQAELEREQQDAPRSGDDERP